MNGQSSPLSFWERRSGDATLYFVVYSVYLAVLFLVRSRNSVLNIALLYPDCLQFILVPAYLFILYRRDRYALRDCAVTRNSSRKAAFDKYIAAFPGETLLFWTPYVFLQILGAVLAGKPLLVTVYAIMLELILLLSAGLFSSFVNIRFRTKAGQIIVYLLLVLDYLQANGILLREEGSLFYYPFITVWNSTEEKSSLWAFRALFSLFAMGVVMRMVFGTVRKKRFLDRDLLRRALWSLPFGLMWGVLQNINGAGTVERAWLSAYGCQPPDGTEASFLTLLFSLIPFTVALLLFGNAIAGKLSDAAVLIFPRAGARKNWWTAQMGKLAAAYFLYCLGLLFSCTAASLFYGRAFASFSTGWKTAVLLLLTNGLMTLVMILACNLWSIGRDARTGMLFAAGLFAFGCLTALTGSPVVIHLYLPGRASLLLHTPPRELLESFPTPFDMADPSLFPWQTGVCGLLCLACLAVLGERRLEKIDIL